MKTSVFHPVRLLTRFSFRKRPGPFLIFGLSVIFCVTCVVALPAPLRGSLWHIGRDRLKLLFQRSEVAAGPADVRVVLDGTVQYQTLDGFGQAEPSVLVYPGPQTLSDSLRAAVEKIRT